jgi:hypothetical protein
MRKLRLKLTRINKPLLQVIKKLSTPTKAAVAPFRASKLTHYLSELLGGNAIVVGLGLLANGEPVVSRKVGVMFEVACLLNVALWIVVLLIIIHVDHCIIFYYRSWN